MKVKLYYKFGVSNSILARGGRAAELTDEGVVVASRQFPVRDSGIRHQEAALGCGGVRGQGRVLWAARPARGKEIGQGAHIGFCTKAERKNGGRVRAHPRDRGRRRGWVRSCHVEEDIMGGGGLAADGMRTGSTHGQSTAVGAGWCHDTRK
jgi:hypothetical protein